MYLVHDIEAVPETEIHDMWIEEKAKREAQGKVVYFEDIWAFKVICIGMLVLDKDLKPVQGGLAKGGLSGGSTEKEMIQRWSDIASGDFFGNGSALRLVDWNGAKFDVPVLQTRAFRHGIQLPWLFGLQPDPQQGVVTKWSKEYRDRYQGKHDDVSELWTNRGAFAKPHLANLARLMGLPGKVGMDGSKVYEAYIAKQYAEIDLYCLQDVIQTAFVFQRFRYIAGKMTLAQYQAAAAALCDWTFKQPGQQDFASSINTNALLLNEGVSSGNADSDDRGDNLVSAGSGGVAAGAAVHGAAGVRPEGSV